MAKFNFRLQGFLNIKEKMEEQKKNEYGKAQKKLEEEKQKKIELELRHQHLLEELRKKMQFSGIRPNELQQYNNYIAYTLEEIELQQQAIEREEIVVNQKREEVIQAMKERKMLETVKEKKYEQYLDEEKKAEQRIVDEIVSFKYNSN